MHDLQQRVTDLIVDQMQCRENEVQLSTSLADDIGMEGDDADEFFAKFAEEFPGDYSELGRHWHRHFHPEGGLVSFPPELFVVSGAGALAGIALHSFFSWIPGWLAITGCLVVFLVADMKFYAWRHPNTDPPMRTITVQNLVDAAASGRWPLEYTAEDDLLPSYYNPSVVPPRD
jgi:Protein of unknown function (DUF1493)